MFRKNPDKLQHLSLKALTYFHKMPIRFMNQVARSHGDIAGFQCVHQRLWVIRKPTLAEILIKRSDFVKSSMIFKQLYPLTGRKGLVQLEDKDWKERFHAIKPQFSLQGVDESLPWLAENIEHVLNQLNNGAVNVSPLIMKMTMNNIMIMLGIEERLDVTPIINDMLVLNRLCGQRMRQLFRWPMFLPLSSHRIINRTSYELRKKLNGLLQTKKIRAHSPLHQLQQNWCPRECLDHFSTFLFAGFETTASSITTALYYLAQNSELQQLILNESASFEKLSVPLMKQWKWAHALYCETLRMHPPAYMLTRQPTSEIHLEGITFSPKDLIIINVHGLQRHEDYWLKPKLFDATRHYHSSPFANKAFMPFGLGKRICSGHLLAMIESMMMFSMLCRRFRVSTSNGIKPIMNAEITLHPRSYLWLKCDPR